MPSAPTVTIVRRPPRGGVGQDPLELADLVAAVDGAVGAVVLHPDLAPRLRGQRREPAHRRGAVAERPVRERRPQLRPARVDARRQSSSTPIASSASARVAIGRGAPQVVVLELVDPVDLELRDAARAPQPEAAGREHEVPVGVVGVGQHLEQLALALELGEELERLLAGEHLAAGRMGAPLHAGSQLQPRLDAAFTDRLPDAADEPDVALFRHAPRLPPTLAPGVRDEMPASGGDSIRVARARRAIWQRVLTPRRHGCRSAPPARLRLPRRRPLSPPGAGGRGAWCGDRGLRAAVTAILAPRT